MKKTIALVAILTGVIGTAAFAASPSSVTATHQRASLQRNNQDPTDPNVPGATGRTIVIGDPSTIAGDAAATRMLQTGDYGGGGG